VTYNGESTSPVVHRNGWAISELVGSCSVHVAYIVKVYAPMWFSIKGKPSCKDGARHLLCSIQLSCYLSVEHKCIVNPIKQRNAYFAHPENLLLSMITDDRQHIRKLAILRILKARSSSRTSAVRQFKVPKLRFDAHEVYDLIDWQNSHITEPPLTTDISEYQLKLFVTSVNRQWLTFLSYLAIRRL